MTYFTIRAIKAANKERGHHFFEASTMRFFDSRILEGVINGRYFVTSERFHGSNGYVADRRYTVRRAKDDGEINTEGEFQAYRTAGQARKAAKRLDY